ncbi:MAG TPA: formylglycine-generating enzyme family protein, partial [Candidatus Sumerlaeota bacterium]|nr:formylglycine-generating enzyme family protein [Candidatus Sumerlaeota bacterium]
VSGNCRSASRTHGEPSLSGDALGFRIVCVPSVGEVTASTPSDRLQKETEPQTEAGTDENMHIVRGEVFSNPIGMEFRNISAGSFLMGFQKGAETQIQSFYLGIHEVTQEQYEKVMGSNPSYFKGARRPVEMVSWEDAQIFCQKLSQQEKDRTYRLPTEAEWEYAARAGTQTDYFFGNDDASLTEYGWCEENSCRETTDVGTRKPNPWGLFDMCGNVWELCADRYPNYPVPENEQVDINDPTIRTSCVIRGGSWDRIYLFCRSVSRSTIHSYDRSMSTGFRVVAVPESHPSSSSK